MPNESRATVRRRLLDVAIVLSLLAALVVLFGSLQTTLLGIPFSLTKTANPLLLLAVLVLLRVAITAGWKSMLLLVGSITFSFVMVEAGARVAAYLAPAAWPPGTAGSGLLDGRRGPGRYRIIYEAVHDQLVILGVRIGHRREVYR